MLDRALRALIEGLEETAELDALAAMPYEDDVELAWEPIPGPDLPYVGGVPAAVLEMAAERKRSAR